MGFVKTVTRMLKVIWQMVEDHLDQLKWSTCGTMVGSAVGAAIFFPAELESRNYCQFSVGIFTLSTVMFGYLNRVAIAKNGPCGIAGISIVSILALISRPSPQELLPYLPLSVAMGLMILVFVVPCLHNGFLAPWRLTEENLSHGQGGSYSGLSHLATYSPHSIRSDESLPRTLGGYNPSDLTALLHIGPLERFGPFLYSGSSDDATSIDLEAAFESTSSAETEPTDHLT